MQDFGIEGRTLNLLNQAEEKISLEKCLNKMTTDYFFHLWPVAQHHIEKRQQQVFQVSYSKWCLLNLFLASFSLGK